MPRGVGNCPEHVVEVAEIVEELALMAALAQQLMGVLAMDFDQHFAEIAQRRDRRRAAIDEGARASVSGHDAPQIEGGRVVAVRHGLLFEPCLGALIAVNIPLAGDVRLLRPSAYEAAVGTVAQQQADGVNQDRFAGAGFPSEHGQPDFKVQGDGVDYGEIADVQVDEHAGGLRRGCVPSEVWCAGLRNNYRTLGETVGVVALRALRTAHHRHPAGRSPVRRRCTARASGRCP